MTPLKKIPGVLDKYFRSFCLHCQYCPLEKATTVSGPGFLRSFLGRGTDF